MNKGRYVIIEDELGLEPNAIQDDVDKVLYEQDNYDMNKICNLLNKQDQQIEALQEQLKGAVIPKFKIGDRIYLLDITNKYILDFVIHYISIEKHILSKENRQLIIYYGADDGIWCDEENAFSTKAEAEKRLAELKGESK